MSSDRKPISDYLGLAVAIGCAAKGQEETCRNVENAPYLTCDYNFTALNLHQNLPQKIHFKLMYLTVFIPS